MYENDLQKSALKKVDQAKIRNVLRRLEYLRTRSNIKLKSLKLHKMNEWVIDKSSENIFHKSGKFFSIRGIKFFLNKNFFSQPMIFQSEVGILGILARKEKGTLKFLLQAKFEPGIAGHLQFREVDPLIGSPVRPNPHSRQIVEWFSLPLARAKPQVFLHLQASPSTLP